MTTYRDILRQVGWPVRAVVIDFECYFGTGYGLKGTSTLEYISDVRFRFVSVALRSMAEPMPGGAFEKFFSGPEIEDGSFKRYITSPWFEQVTWLIQNARFDALIMKHKLGLEPPYILDLLDIDRMLNPRAQHSLEAQAEAEDLEPKGDTQQFKDLHWEDMDTFKRSALETYNIRDCRAEAELFKRKIPKIQAPAIEIPLMRHTLKMALEPMMVYDAKLAARLVRDMQMEIAGHLRRTGLTEKQLGSRDYFRDQLQTALDPGEMVPTKPGAKGPIPALAKQDDGLKWLMGHKNERVRDLIEARCAIRSWPLHVKRVLRMTRQAQCLKGKIWAPLKYYGGHTGRWSGDMGINEQNLGGKGRGKSIHPLIGAMRGLLMAPVGYKLCICDLGQIEARMLAWMAGQSDLLGGFASGSDIYSDFATTLFCHEVREPRDGDSPEQAKQFSIERGFGKDAILGCLAEGTPILTNNGWKLIERVTMSDQVWDGIEWVRHQGVICQGQKLCVNVNGLWLTPEHEIWQPGGWITAQELSTRSQRSGQSTETLLSLPLSVGRAVGSSPSNVIAPVVEQLLHIGAIWSAENLHAVMCVLKQHPAKLRAMSRLSQNHIRLDCLIEFVRLLADVKSSCILDMAKEVSECGPHGSRIELIFLNTWARYQDGIIRILKSTGQITIEDMNPEISDLLADSSKCVTLYAGDWTEKGPMLCVDGAGRYSCVERLANDSVINTALVVLPTYDILNAGPRHRFQTRSMLVANCGYGMGADKFFANCRANDSLRPLFDTGQYDWNFIKRLIDTYRSKYAKIPELWKIIERAFKYVTKYPGKTCDVQLLGSQQGTSLSLSRSGHTTTITLPLGRMLYYPYANVDAEGQITYRDGYLWGGSLTENCDQAMSRDILAPAILECERNNIPVVLHCHDEIVGCVPEDQADTALKKMNEIMTTNPIWADGIPLFAKGAVSNVYCK